MRLSHRTLFAVAGPATLLAASTALAFPFPPVESSSIALGGAGVAGATGIGAAQVNPAGIAEGMGFELVLPEAGFRGDDLIGVKDTMEKIDDLLGGSSLSTWALAATPAQVADLRALILGLDQPGKDSVDISASGSVGVGFPAWGLALGIGYSDLILASAIADIDSLRVDSNALSPAFIGGNRSRLDLKGIEARQAVFTAARSFGPQALGVTLRQMSAKAYLGTASVFNDSDVDILDRMKETAKGNTATALDAGVRFGILPMLKGGLTARNLVAPRFTFPDGSTYTMKPKYRAGVRLDLPLLKVLADLDLNSTESFNPGARYREAALGTELGLGPLALRAGVSRNLAMGGSPTLLHGGLGLRLGVFNLDLSGAAGSEKRNLQFGVNTALRF